VTPRRIALGVLGLLGAGLLGWAAVLQLNDPDPVRWVAIYGGAALACAATALAPRVWPLAAAAAVVAAAWSATLLLGLERLATWAELTTDQPMHGGPVEESREGLGLLLAALWCLGVLALGRVVSRRASARSAATRT
jgi:hypothetical protein